MGHFNVDETMKKFQIALKDKQAHTSDKERRTVTILGYL